MSFIIVIGSENHDCTVMGTEEFSWRDRIQTKLYIIIENSYKKNQTHRLLVMAWSCYYAIIIYDINNSLGGVSC